MGGIMTVNLNASTTQGFGITSDTSGIIQFQKNGTNTVTVGTATANLAPSAGTASVAPIILTSGTNLSSPAAGAIEYDGRLFYGTPQANQRGLMPNEQFYRLNSDLLGLNATGSQSIYGVGCTLASSTVYYFQMYFGLYKTAGTTGHQLSFLFGGTATVNSFQYGGPALWGSQTWPIVNINSSSFVDNNTTASSIIGGTASTATREYIAHWFGTISVNAGGTFIPQYALSAAPGGAYSTMTGSFMRIYPIGPSGANTNIGTWA